MPQVEYIPPEEDFVFALENKEEIIPFLVISLKIPKNLFIIVKKLRAAVKSWNPITSHNNIDLNISW